MTSEAGLFEVFRTKSSLYKYLMYCNGVPNDEMADVLQEAMLNAWRTLPTFNGECALSSWVYLIIKGVLHNRRHYLNAEKRRRVESFDTAEMFNVKGLSGVSYIGDIEKALSKMPKDFADVLTQATLGDSMSEIADKLKIPSGTVRSRLHRARQMLADNGLSVPV